MNPSTQDREATFRAALGYAERGLFVMPLPYGKKAPVVARWNERKGEKRSDGSLIDEDGPYWQCVAGRLDYRAWVERQFRRGERRNIALAIPYRCIVIDVDPPGGKHGKGDGPALIAAYEATHGPLPATWIQRTPSGGMHLLYRLPAALAEADLSQATKLLGLDVRVAGKGYIVAAPSVSDGSQTAVGRWAWDDPLFGEVGTLDGPPDEEPAELPEEFWHWYNAQGNAERTEKAPQPSSSPSSAASSSGTNSGLSAQRKALAALENKARLVASAGEGRRNATLFENAVYLFELARGGHLDAGLVVRELTNAALSAGLKDHEIRQTLASAERKGSTPKDPPASEPRNLPAREHRPRAAAPSTPVPAEPPAQRPEIVVDHEIARMVREAIAALADSGLPVYQRGAEIVSLCRETRVKIGDYEVAGGTTAGATGPGRLLELLSMAADWIKRDSRMGDGGFRPTKPPPDVIRAVAERKDWPGIPALIAVSESPVLRPDGSVFTGPGYDPETGCFVDTAGVWSGLGGAVTQADAAAALEALREPLCDFPFESEKDREAAVAAIVTACVRPSIHGPCPMFLFSATTRGSGKTLLAEVVAVIAQGRKAPCLGYVDNPEEMRKQITTLVVSGFPLVLFDNLGAHGLGDPNLDRLLTADRWQDRGLGTMQAVGAAVRTTFLATGNNVSFRGDTARRCIRCHQAPDQERPEERSGFRYPDLFAHVQQHRRRLFAAALTIARGYILAGRPAVPLPPVGSFEQWGRMVRDALVWAGAPAVATAAAEGKDEERDALARFVAVLHEAFGEKAVPVGRILSLEDEAAKEAIAEFCPGKEISPQRLGKRLRYYAGRVVTVDGQSMRLENAEDAHAKVQNWRVKCTSLAGSAGGCGERFTPASKNQFHMGSIDHYPQIPALPANPPSEDRYIVDSEDSFRFSDAIQHPAENRPGELLAVAPDAEPGQARKIDPSPTGRVRVRLVPGARERKGWYDVARHWTTLCTSAKAPAHAGEVEVPTRTWLDRNYLLVDEAGAPLAYAEAA